jgi:hypothetical protein
MHCGGWRCRRAPPASSLNRERSITLSIRFMSRLAFGHTATIDAYPPALGKTFGEDVVARGA